MSQTPSHQNESGNEKQIKKETPRSRVGKSIVKGTKLAAKTALLGTLAFGGYKGAEAGVQMTRQKLAEHSQQQKIDKAHKIMEKFPDPLRAINFLSAGKSSRQVSQRQLVPGFSRVPKYGPVGNWSIESEVAGTDALIITIRRSDERHSSGKPLRIMTRRVNEVEGFLKERVIIVPSSVRELTIRYPLETVEEKFWAKEDPAALQSQVFTNDNGMDIDTLVLDLYPHIRENFAEQRNETLEILLQQAEPEDKTLLKNLEIVKAEALAAQPPLPDPMAAPTPQPTPSATPTPLPLPSTPDPSATPTPYDSWMSFHSSSLYEGAMMLDVSSNQDEVTLSKGFWNQGKWRYMFSNSYTQLEAEGADL